MKQLTILCAFALSLSLLAGCTVTPPSDEAFQRDLADAVADSIEEAAEDWAQDWEAALDEAAEAWSGRDENGVEKDHYWKVLDSEGSEIGTVTDPEQVKAVDALLDGFLVFGFSLLAMLGVAAAAVLLNTPSPVAQATAIAGVGVALARAVARK